MQKFIIAQAGQNTKIKGDAAIAMISVGALAIGYLLMNIFATGPNLSGDVCSTLFGSTSILTLKIEQVWLCVVMAIVVVIVFVVFYHKIFCVTFDETFAKATGIQTDKYNLLIAVITAVIMSSCNESGRFTFDFGTCNISGIICHAYF
ncbi:MAG: metal ABC transporter permease [Dorea sp.]